MLPHKLCLNNNEYGVYVIACGSPAAPFGLGEEIDRTLSMMHTKSARSKNLIISGTKVSRTWHESHVLWHSTDAMEHKTTTLKSWINSYLDTSEKARATLSNIAMGAGVVSFLLTLAAVITAHH